MVSARTAVNPTSNNARCYGDAIDLGEAHGKVAASTRKTLAFKGPTFADPVSYLKCKLEGEFCLGKNSRKCQLFAVPCRFDGPQPVDGHHHQVADALRETLLLGMPLDLLLNFRDGTRAGQLR